MIGEDTLAEIKMIGIPMIAGSIIAGLVIINSHRYDNPIKNITQTPSVTSVTNKIIDTAPVTENTIPIKLCATQVIIGMSKEDVIKICEQPKVIKIIKTERSISETFIYNYYSDPSDIISILNDKVESILYDEKF